MTFEEIFKAARILPDNPSHEDRFTYGDLRLLVKYMLEHMEEINANHTEEKD